MRLRGSCEIEGWGIGGEGGHTCMHAWFFVVCEKRGFEGRRVGEGECITEQMVRREGEGNREVIAFLDVYLSYLTAVMQYAWSFHGSSRCIIDLVRLLSNPQSSFLRCPFLRFQSDEFCGVDYLIRTAKQTESAPNIDKI